ncbi:unnamed protein product [Pedinophyceae sp. YPF-701]|nr:unnamed protein product [Pedinophyceae sp. YPF-701]
MYTRAATRPLPAPQGLAARPIAVSRPLHTGLCVPPLRPAVHRRSVKAHVGLNDWGLLDNDAMVGFSRTKAYSYGVCGAIATGFLAMIDAGFSGDWSRIGAISTDAEALCRTITYVALPVHGAMGLWAASIAADKGENGALWFLKTTFVGTAALFEIRHREPAEAS